MTDLRWPKSQRISLRATERQEVLLRRAAEMTDHTLTDFILDSAVANAQSVLADQRWFIATDEQYQQFTVLLDAPLPSTDRFDRLFSRSSQLAEQ